jgi:predicted HicB family RNase H-like nuclease
MTKKVKIKVSADETQTYELGPDVDLEAEDIRDSQGRRITQDYVEQAVADTYERLSRGRPSLSGRGEHSPEVRARVPRQLKEQLTRAAEEQGRSPSAVVREALERYLEKRRRKAG